MNNSSMGGGPDKSPKKKSVAKGKTRATPNDKNSGKPAAKSPSKKKSAQKPLNLNIKEGGLHESLGIPKDEKVPLAKEKAALKSKSPKVRKEAQLAINMRKWDKK